MKQLEIKMPVGGEWHGKADTVLPDTYASRISDFNVLPTGELSPRLALNEIAAGQEITGGFGFRGKIVYCDRGDLKVLDPDNGDTTLLGSVGDGSTLNHTKYNDKTYFATKTGLWSADEAVGAIKHEGVLPPVQLPTVTEGGGEDVPTQVAVSTITQTGEESGAVFLGSYPTGVTLSDIVIPENGKLAIYVGLDGAPLRRAIVYAVGGEDYVSAPPEGALCTTLDLEPFPAITDVTWVGGRLYAYSGQMLYFSNPFVPHLMDRRYGQFQMSKGIKMVQAVEGGLYVADDIGLWYVSGGADKPRMGFVGGQNVVSGSGLSVMAHYLPPEHFRGDSSRVAIWLTTEGYFAGDSRGRVVRIHKGRVKLNDGLSGRTALITDNGVNMLITMLNTDSKLVFELGD